MAIFGNLEPEIKYDGDIIQIVRAVISFSTNMRISNKTNN